jgi:hypothetical protein
MKIKITILILCVIVFSCKKDKNIVLNGTLTGCPINTTCSYNYYDNADFNTYSQLVSGHYRAFIYKSVNNNLCDATDVIFFKSSLNSNEFDITPNQIAAGQVDYYFSCACCDVLANIKPIGGEIKGKRTDATHWLINATVILGTAADKPLDTLKVNQDFTLSAIQ